MIVFTETMQTVWRYLINAGMTKAGAAGMMGNLYAESGVIPNRVELLCLQRLRENGKYYTNATYTAFVDDGTISRAQFLNPLPGKVYGFGLAQWTSPSRKAGLYDLCRSRSVSIGDLTTQLDYLVQELKANYYGVWKILTSTPEVLTASNRVLIDFESPADTGAAMRQLRYKYSYQFYDRFSEVVTMTEAQARNKVIAKAKAETGYHEKNTPQNLNSKTASNDGSGNYTKYGKEMNAIQPSNMNYPDAWCDSFVDWLFYKCFGKELGKQMLCGDFDDYTVASAELYKRAGRWTVNPAAGYQIFFRNSTGICHTGLVVEVKNGTVYTVEGNSSNAVREKTYAVGDTSIEGYGMPKYHLAAGVEDSDVVAVAPVVSTPETIKSRVGSCTVTLGQYVQGTDANPEIKTVQRLLNAKGIKGRDRKKLTVDGVLGDNTAYAIETLQKKAGMKNINFGTVAAKTWELLLK